MKFTATKITGVWEIDIDQIEDSRGFFARSHCCAELAKRSLAHYFPQESISFNKSLHTLRGMHLQIAPQSEAKIVRCTAGAIFDVALDLRPSSATFLQWTATELNSENRKSLYIPEGCAHGFLTLQDNSEVLYHISKEFAPEFSRGLRWNDPLFSIVWPYNPVVISDRDANYPNADVNHLLLW